tara:strand:- start:282 stop:476 length:195 start_codon:yes stop_codon:yes gene_type:complete
MFNTLTSFPVFSGFIGVFLINDSVLGFIHEVSFLAITNIVIAPFTSIFREKIFALPLENTISLV